MKTITTAAIITGPIEVEVAQPPLAAVPEAVAGSYQGDNSGQIAAGTGLDTPHDVAVEPHAPTAGRDECIRPVINVTTPPPKRDIQAVVDSYNLYLQDHATNFYDASALLLFIKLPPELQLVVLNAESNSMLSGERRGVLEDLNKAFSNGADTPLDLRGQEEDFIDLCIRTIKEIGSPGFDRYDFIERISRANNAIARLLVENFDTRPLVELLRDPYGLCLRLAKLEAGNSPGHTLKLNEKLSELCKERLRER